VDPSVAKIKELFGSDGKVVWDFRNDGCSFNYQGSPGELFVDGDMEAADTSAWQLARGLGTLSKQTTNPHGGSRLLRVDYDASWEAAQQTVMVIGGRYRAHGWARSDGTAIPAFNDVAGDVWTGTTSTSWQEVNVDFTARNTRARLRKTSAAGVYVEFDDFTLTEIPGYALCPNLVTPGTYDGTQVLASNMLLANPTGWNGGLGAEAVAAEGLQMLSHAIGSDVFGRLVQDTPFTVALLSQWTSNTNGQRLLGAGRLADNKPWQEIYNLSGVWRTAKADDAGTSSSNNDGAIDLNRHSFIWAHHGTTETAWLDKVVTAINGSPSDRGLTTLDLFSLGSQSDGGVYASPADAMYVEVWFATTDCDLATAQAIHDFWVIKHGGI
jgi:hypothetical protein